MISIIAAIARNGVIGKDNQLPWRLPGEMKRFRSLTTGHTVIMGRKTFESLKSPLPHRNNIVVTRTPDFRHKTGFIFIARSTEDALAIARKFTEPPREIFIIGGAAIYREFIGQADRMYLTLLDADFDGDTLFPKYDKNAWTEVDRSGPISENGISYECVTLLRK